MFCYSIKAVMACELLLAEFTHDYLTPGNMLSQWCIQYNEPAKYDKCTRHV